MAELTLRHKRILGHDLLDADDDVFSEMVVPSEITPDIAAFAAELSPLPPQHVLLIADDDATYGWPADGVRARIARDGGDIRFGWRLRAWPNMMLVAIFHAVWIDPQGAPIDITPDVTEGDTSLFVPAPPDLDPSQPPVPRYRITHVRPDASAAIAARIARLKTGQRAYEERRAAKAGQTLEEWFNDKYHPDTMAILLPPFIKACELFDAKLPTLPELITEPMVERYLPETPEVPNEGLDDPVTMIDSADASPEANPTADTPSEPDSVAAADTGTQDEPAADGPGGDDNFVEEEAESQLWTAMDKIEEWTRTRMQLRTGITVLGPDA